MPKLVALYSPAMSMGKTTVANHLVEAFDFTLVKFAAALKDMIRVLLQKHAGIAPDMVERYVDGDLKELVIPEFGVTARWMMQHLGTAWGRDLIRSDLWVHLAKLRVQTLLTAGHDVVIDDMRFMNELAMVRALGGEPVRICRKGVGLRGTHESEGALDGVWMRTIDNDGTIDQLKVDVARLVGDLHAH